MDQNGQHLPVAQGGGQAPDMLGRIPATHMNVGAVEIESRRAIAERLGQIEVAKRFPRSMAQARAELMEACKSPEFAQAAFYSVPNRGSGPSIRFAEEVARCYGNFQYGHRELSRRPAFGTEPGSSEVEVFAWDVERNNYSPRQITVLHILDRAKDKGGPKPLTDQTDIDNRVANVASKQMRGRILALVAKDLVAAGIAECKRTLAGNNDKPMSVRIAHITEAFGRMGVKPQALANYLKLSKVDDMTVEEIADIQGVYNAIKEGAKISEYFGGEEQAALPSTAANAVRAAATSGGQPAAGASTGKPAASTASSADKKPAGAKPAAKTPQPAAPVPSPPEDDEPPPNTDDAPPEEPLF
jgi:hypothetical protein